MKISTQYVAMVLGRVDLPKMLAGLSKPQNPAPHYKTSPLADTKCPQNVSAKPEPAYLSTLSHLRTLSVRKTC